MFTNKMILFKKTRDLSAKITEFLNNISESAQLFERAVDSYVFKGDDDNFELLLNKVAALEARNDQLRRTIESKLYEQTLIPESRADVLELLEGLDRVVNMFEAQLYQFSIEKVMIKDTLVQYFLELTESVVNAVEALVRSARAFFVNIAEIGENIQKVMFFEKQGDMIGTKLKRMIFDDKKMDLSLKIQLRMLCDDIDGIADISEDVADQLSIYAIKRHL